MIRPFLVLKASAKLFSRVAVPFYIPTSSLLVTHFLYIHASIRWCHCLISSILKGVWWYFIVDLICISLITNDFEHFFTCLFAICISSSGKCLCMSYAHFLNGLLGFLNTQFWMFFRYSTLLLFKNVLFWTCMQKVEGKV